MGHGLIEVALLLLGFVRILIFVLQPANILDGSKEAN